MSEKILVTSALPYVNNVPHLGNLVCVISADVYTRFLRLMHKDVISILGTDEHGTTSETKALEEGLTPKELCDKYFKIHKEIYDWFECDFDCFGRTSSKDNAEVTIGIFKRLQDNGYIVEDTVDQLYCNVDKRFLADRFVEGECPKCHYKDARGDQCENCGSLLNATELLHPKCKICKATPVIKSSTHLFIDLPKLKPELSQWMDSVKSGWSDNALTMTEAWMKEGLKKRAISRDLKWGIPVPGYPDKVFYSWFDAPIGYIGITKENRKDWHELWHDPDIRLVQFMGKDNIPFHTILFPAYLIGSHDNYTLMKDISVNEFLNYEGGQFSKSRNIGVFGNDAISTGLKPDVYRYYLMINRPERMDTDFTWEDFQKKNNGELVGNIGNLINRTIVLMQKSFHGIIPEAAVDESDNKVWKDIQELEEHIHKLAQNISIKEALKEIMHISKVANQYLQDNEPWKNPDMKRRSACLYLLANIVKDLSILIEPYMPATSASIRQQYNIVGKPSWEDLGKMSMKPGHKMNNAELLFRKIEDTELKILKEQYSGKLEKKPMILQLRIAKIIGVRKHPDASKLYIEDIDLGDEKRQIISGLVGHYTEDELVGKKVVVVTNLEPAKLRGIDSNGMLLAAEHNGIIGLLTSTAAPGEYVYSDEEQLEQLKKLPMISIKEFTQLRLHAKNSKAYYDNQEMKVSKGSIMVEKVAEGHIR